MKAKTVLLLPVLLCLTGCSIFAPSQSPTITYDLGRPPQIKTLVPVEVETFSNLTGHRYRMSYRDKDEHQVVGSDFRKWIQPPGTMFTRYLRLAFRNNESEMASLEKQKIFLSGEILVFESKNGYAELGLKYNLRFKGKIFSKTVLMQEKMQNMSSDEFADAMNLAALKFAKMAAQEADAICSRK